MNGIKLILFDVDGVLIVTQAISYDYWHEVVKRHFGFNVSRNDIYMEGKTDKGIIKEFLELNGIKNPFSDNRFTKALNDIGSIVGKAIENKKIDKIPNVEKLLQKLIEEKHILGLLTGNSQEKAKVKLQNCGLWEYFKVGAFGDITDNRSELVSIAMNDAQKKTGIEFSKEDVFIIGDTIRDIQCAKEGGVKSVAVATGRESFETLKQENPDFIFKDFSDIDKIMKCFK